nr:uncharacterized protein LOC127304068 [Lolium perenne]
MQATCANLSRLAVLLKDWSHTSFGSVRREIKRLETALRRLRSSPISDAVIAEEKVVERLLCELFEREEIMVRQRSRVDWLREGDRNTAFFHAKATARKKANRIASLQHENGTLCSDQEEIKGMVHGFYEDLFTAEPLASMDIVLEAVPEKVKDYMNEDLCKPYSDEEIKAALFQMGPTKAPGPDGFPAMFYQVHWDLVREDVCNAVRSFLGGDEIPEGFCDSVIVLIPKSAFVPGRLLTDSAIVAYECLQTVRRQNNKSTFFALKIDMMKAYDPVEWEYLHGCLSKLGFAAGWIDTVMRCVTSARYAVKVNDDSIFFARSDPRSVQALKIALNTYCEASGQKVNLQKSSLFFGNKCPDSVKARVKDVLGVSSEILHDTYLGMPTEIARASTASFNSLVEKVWRCVTSVSGRPLSRAGKGVWLKSVAQSIQNHVMSCFQVPVTSCEKMRASIANHWWGFDEGRKKMHWKSWNWLTAPKSLGGLGFRDFVMFNQAMLAKQGWRLITEPSSLCARVLKGRYFPNSDFLSAVKPRSSSFTWRSILYGRELLLRGLRWGIGNGERVSIMKDSWIPDHQAGMFNSLSPIPATAKVRFLMNDRGTAWEEDSVRAFFHEELADKILGVPISRLGGEEFLAL